MICSLPKIMVTSWTESSCRFPSYLCLNITPGGLKSEFIWWPIFQSCVPRWTHLKTVCSRTWLQDQSSWGGLARHLLPSLCLMLHPSAFCQSWCQQITNLLEKHGNKIALLIPGFPLIFCLAYIFGFCLSWEERYALKWGESLLPHPRTFRGWWGRILSTRPAGQRWRWQLSLIRQPCLHCASHLPVPLASPVSRWQPCCSERLNNSCRSHCQEVSAPVLTLLLKPVFHPRMPQRPFGAFRNVITRHVSIRRKAFKTSRKRKGALCFSSQMWPP